VRIYTCWWILKRTSYPRHFYWFSSLSSHSGARAFLSFHTLFPFNLSLPAFCLCRLVRLPVPSKLNTSNRRCCMHNCKVKSSPARLMLTRPKRSLMHLNCIPWA
jgi:hypothetical protein